MDNAHPFASCRDCSCCSGRGSPLRSAAPSAQTSRACATARTRTSVTTCTRGSRCAPSPGPPAARGCARRCRHRFRFSQVPAGPGPERHDPDRVGTPHRDDQRPVRRLPPMPNPRGLRAAGCHHLPCACRGLRDNRLSGTIPTELGRLTKLRNSVCARVRPMGASRAWPTRPLCRGHPRGVQVPRPQFAQRHAPEPAWDADEATLLFVRRRHRAASTSRRASEHGPADAEWS